MGFKVYILILIACVLQTFIYSRHVKKINAHFSEMNKKGNVLVGRKSSFLKGGSIVMMSVSNDGTIEQTYFINGRTSFAKPKEITYFNGLKIDELNVENYKKLNNITKQAIENAKFYFEKDREKLRFEV